MSEMSIAALACYLDALDKHAHIPIGLNIFFRQGGEKTRPSGAGIEFRVRAEKRILTADAAEQTAIMQQVVSAGESSVSALVARDVILFGVEQFPPLGIRANQFRHGNRVQSLAAVSKRHDHD